ASGSNRAGRDRGSTWSHARGGAKAFGGGADGCRGACFGAGGVVRGTGWGGSRADPAGAQRDLGARGGGSGGGGGSRPLQRPAQCDRSRVRLPDTDGAGARSVHRTLRLAPSRRAPDGADATGRAAADGRTRLRFVLPRPPDARLHGSK